jgi:hypothetical protein
MTRALHRTYIWTLFFVGLFIVASIGFYGWEYYETPVAERNDHALHDQLSPTGFWGHGMGFIGAFLMTFGVIMYSLRKRWSALSGWGAIRHVLEFHIFLCLVGPALIVYHTAFKFGGIISVSFWCMVVVVASGVIGRYLYMQIPKTIAGTELSPVELHRQIKQIRDRLRSELGVEETVLEEIDRWSGGIQESARASLLTTFPRLVIHNYRQSRRIHELIHRFAQTPAGNHKLEDIRLALVEKTRLQRQAASLTITQRLFRHWHMFHLPFAIVMFLIMVVHIVVAFLFGYGWIFTA